MRIAKVVGTVTLNRFHPSMRGATLKLAVPMTGDELRADSQPAADTLVVYDEFGAGIGDKIMLSEGAEAAQPFYPELIPLDAYNAGIIDRLSLK
ncbi:MAG: EutN/CcmL family microcompartment protein [Planctomycetales bacterium]|nr:EutN/CcmL family microcompartment protein [Planctomycetales bacterium]